MSLSIRDPSEWHPRCNGWYPYNFYFNEPGSISPPNTTLFLRFLVILDLVATIDGADFRLQNNNNKKKTYLVFILKKSLRGCLQPSGCLDLELRMAVDVATKYWFCNPPPPSQCIGYNIYIICIWYDNYMLDKLKGWHSSPVLLKVQVCLSVKPCWYLPCRLEWRLRQLKTAALGNTTGWTLPAEISRNKHIRDTTPPHTSPHIHTTPYHTNSTTNKRTGL